MKRSERKVDGRKGGGCGRGGGQRRGWRRSGQGTANMVVWFEIGFILFFFNDTATTEIYTLSLHDALPISAVVNTEVISHQ